MEKSLSPQQIKKLQNDYFRYSSKIVSYNLQIKLVEDNSPYGEHSPIIDRLIKSKSELETQLEFLAGIFAATNQIPKVNLGGIY